MGVTQGNDGERVILTDGFYLQGKSHRQKTIPFFRRNVARGIVPVGSLFCSLASVDSVSSVFLHASSFPVSSFSVFLAGNMVPLIGDEQRFLFGKVQCNSCVLRVVTPSAVPNCPSCEIEVLALELCVCC